MTFYFAVCDLTGGAILQILKHIISTDRPVSVFEHYQNLVLPLVQGVNMHHSNSFPSGHASTFFMFCTCCVILMAIHCIREGKLRDLKTKIWFNATLLLLLIFAALGAYSRVYISQHFLSDICVGSIIGFTTPFLMLYLFRDRMRRIKTKK
jgi:membrane-associated phospholipid phosphatase